MWLEDSAHTSTCRHRRPRWHSEVHRRWGVPEARTNHMCDGGQGAATRARRSLRVTLPLKDGASDSGRTPVGVSQACVGDRGPLGSQHRQAETEVTSRRMLKAGCRLWPGASASLPVDMTLMVVKGCRSPRCGSALLACPAPQKWWPAFTASMSGDQGPRQEDAKYLETKGSRGSGRCGIGGPRGHAERGKIPTLPITPTPARRG